MDNIRTLLVATSIILVPNATSAQENKQMAGKASYYSNGLHGRRMSNGERYDKNGYTCAHKTLPFGTLLHVTNPRNNRSVVVRVTDRGPFVKGRILDLSYSAARDLGILSSGVAYMKVEILPKNKPTEIPFVAEPSTIEIPEIEYGMAGVCYEFIPEWEKPAELDQPKTIARKPQPRQRPTVAQSNTKKTSAQPQNKTQSLKNEPPTSTPPSTAKSQPQKPQSSKPTTSQEKSSSIWSNFFNRVKEGVSGLF